MSTVYFDNFAPRRILVSGSRSLDPHWPPNGGHVNGSAHAEQRFIDLLEDAVARLAVVDGHLGAVVIVHGSSRYGADRWADEWLFRAWESGTIREALHVERHAADVDRYRNVEAAMYARDKAMLATVDRSVPHAVLVSWDGRSDHQARMIRLAEAKGLTIARCS